MAKSKPKSADVRLTTACLYQLLVDPKFAKDYIVHVADKGDEAMLRRAVEDLITALCIRHQRAGKDEKGTKGATSRNCRNEAGAQPGDFM